MFTLLLLTVLSPSLALAQAACTHYASPSGTGNGLSPTTPFRISTFMSVAQPGAVLCLLDGTYTGNNARIEPPPTLHGTPTQPITVRALNDGQVLLDGQGHWVVYLRSQWWVVGGINARNGGEFVYGVFGRHNRVRRSIGWNGSHGQNDSNIWRVTGQADNIAEDCAGWGDNSRKPMDAAQGGDVGQSGYRRCWAEFNDHPQGASQPNNTYQVAYNTWNQLFENVIGTWNRTGQSVNNEGVVKITGNCEGGNNEARGTQMLGSIFYVAPGTSYQPDSVVESTCASGFVLRDIVAYVSPGYAVRPFSLFKVGTRPQSGNTCTNCLAVHAGTPSNLPGNAGWVLPGLRQGQGLAAATGGQSPFTLLPGICKRYHDGQLTDTPLWPWPMDARIREARMLSGRSPITVTSEIESMLGPIPAECEAGDVPPPPPPPPPPPIDPPPPVEPPPPIVRTTEPWSCMGQMELGDGAPILLTLTCTR